MSKLLSLKQWVTLSEAADYLSKVLSEPVTVADIYRFALTGDLILTAHFINHGRARLGEVKRIREAGFKVLPSLTQDKEEVLLSVTGNALPEYLAWLEDNPDAKTLIEDKTIKSKFVCLKGMQISDTECLVLENRASSIDGLWNLTMRGAERLDIEHYLQQEVGGPSVELICLDGVLLRNEAGQYASLLTEFDDDPKAVRGDLESPIKPLIKDRSDPKNYSPCGTLPDDAPLVIRPSALAAFIAKLAEPEAPEKKLATREKDTLLQIIAVLSELSGVDLRQDGGHYEIARAMLPEFDRRSASMSEETLAKKLNAARILIHPVGPGRKTA